MRQIREVLRLKYALKKPQRLISQACGVGKTTVQEYLRRAKAVGLGWPLPEGITEDDLERRLFPAEPVNPTGKTPIPFQYIYEELKRPNVTLSLLWEEYKRAHPDGYQYSWFSERVFEYRARVNYSMRQEHKAGEKSFVDFGDGLNIVDRATWKLIPTKIFVFVWGASKKIYAEATLKEDIPSWIKVNVNALEYSGCCPKAIVPDNLKAAVTKACRYEPEINHTFAEFAEHYGTAIMPARSGKPKDKPLAENGVKLAKRWILARLRNRTFFSLAELNAAIRIVTADLNARQMKKMGKSRDELFLSLDKPNALFLPDRPYEYAQWKKAKVNINYHICFEKHDYSVPYTYIHKEVEIKATANVVEMYFKGQRICSHPRSQAEHQYSTVKEHMPPAHQKHLDWSPERILEWAGKCGTSVKTLVECIINSRRFPEQAYKSCLGIIRLRNHYTDKKLDAACARALRYRIYSYRGVKNILQNGLEDEQELKITSRAPLRHENVRGPEYFAPCLVTSQANLFTQNLKEEENEHRTNLVKA
jgi:transposase